MSRKAMKMLVESVLVFAVRCFINPSVLRFPEIRPNAMTPSITCSTLHLNIAFRLDWVLAQVLQQITSFEILVRMDYRLQLCSAPGTVVSDFLDLLLVCVFEDSG